MIIATRGQSEKNQKMMETNTKYLLTQLTKLFIRHLYNQVVKTKTLGLSETQKKAEDRLRWELSINILKINVTHITKIMFKMSISFAVFHEDYINKKSHAEECWVENMSDKLKKR